MAKRGGELLAILNAIKYATVDNGAEVGRLGLEGLCLGCGRGALQRTLLDNGDRSIDGHHHSCNSLDQGRLVTEDPLFEEALDLSKDCHKGARGTQLEDNL